MLTNMLTIIILTFFQELPEDVWIKICDETKEYIQSKLDEIVS